jgi:serine/threonine protein kinase
MKQRLFGYELPQLACDLEDVDSQVEALTMLSHEIMRNMSIYTLEELDHLKLVLRHLQSSWQQRVPACQEWFIAPHDIKLVGESFAGGASAKIYYGEYMDADVVAKCVEIHSDRDRADFLREVSVWSTASRHPNIVTLYGACLVGSSCLIVCQKMTGGTLPDHLCEQGKEGHCKPWKALLDVVHGLQYLHGQGIVHADLKGNNILMAGLR